MGTSVLVPHWVPEDDLLLKNAIEAGASLESLAKGAVQFSRRFTIVELQERWYSLLYDPLISAESSTQMNELERSTPNLPPKFNFNKTGNSKETKHLPGKGNIRTVRACYRELRKKMRIETFTAMDELNFPVGPNYATYLGNTEGHMSGNGLLEDPLLSNSEFEPSHFDIIHSAFPEILAEDPVEDGFSPRILYPVKNNIHEENMTNEVPHNDIAFSEDFLGVSEPKIISSSGLLVNRSSDFEDNKAFSSPIPDCGPSPALKNLECSSHIPGTAERSERIVSSSALNEQTRRDSNISDTLKDDMKPELLPPVESVAPVASTGTYLAELSSSLLNDEDCMDLDVKEFTDKSYYDGLSSLLVNPPSVSVTQENMSNAADITAETSPVQDNLNGLPVGDNKISGTEAPAFDPHPERVNGVICCGLNTEDPEIPLNDHVFPISPVRPSSSFSWAQRNSKACSSVPPSSRDFPAKMAKCNSRTSILPRQTIRSQGDMKMLQTGLIEESDSKFQSRNDNGVRQGNLAYTASSSSKDMNPEIEKVAIGVETYQNHQQKGNCGDTLEQKDLVMLQEQHAQNTEAEADVNIAMLELDEDPVESDDELPCFSDIEAMILDMDLDPDDQDLFELEVAKYQSEDIKRVIIRLEQGARSYMQREMASRRAFAVLYGRDSKHFIKKQEVLLGRATEEYRIDIDLGRGGSKTQVSRRQAIISLNDDGSFRIRNLGKRSISVNDKELEPGESSNLVSNCLIEIRGMPFIFESNEKCVKRFLDGKRKEQSCEKPSSASGKVS